MNRTINIILSLVLCVIGFAHLALSQTTIKPYAQLTVKTDLKVKEQFLQKLDECLKSLEKINPKAIENKKLLETVLQKKARYVNFIKSMLESESVSQVDLIGQEHSSIIEEEQFGDGFTKSQSEIKTILLQNKYDFVGYENLTEDVLLSPLSLKQYIISMGTVAFGSAPDKEDVSYIDQYIDKLVKQDGSILYSKQNPNSIIKGFEDIDIVNLFQEVHTLVSEGVAPVGLEKDWEVDLQNLKAAWVSMVHLRSWYGLAKVISMMDHHKVKKGAIVFGAAHLDGLMYACVAFGIRSDVYITVPLKAN